MIIDGQQRQLLLAGLLILLPGGGVAADASPAERRFDDKAPARASTQAYGSERQAGGKADTSSRGSRDDAAGAGSQQAVEEAGCE